VHACAVCSSSAKQENQKSGSELAYFNIKQNNAGERRPRFGREHPGIIRLATGTDDGYKTQSTFAGLVQIIGVSAAAPATMLGDDRLILFAFAVGITIFDPYYHPHVTQIFKI
jgi:hypothetical protein